MCKKFEGPWLCSRESGKRADPNASRVAPVGRFAAFDFHQVKPDRLYIRAQIERLDLQNVMQIRHRVLRHPPTRFLRTASGNPATLSATPASRKKRPVSRAIS